MRRLEVRNLGVVEYDDGLDLQESLRARRAAGEIEDQLLLLEHPPVVTVGRNAGTDNLRLAPAELAARGIAFHETGRGGDVTFHGPGQIVGYPILDLDPDRRDVKRYVRDLEEVIVRTLSDFGVGAGPIPGLTGVWVGDLKIAAIGVRISRWITTHGFAFNVRTDLSYFDAIVPCGIEDRGVTSLSRALGRDVSPDEVRGPLARRFAEVFGRELAETALSSRSVQVFAWRRGERGPEVLLLKRTAEDGGFWQPVTGMIEDGETPGDAARRELAEETGLSAEPESLDYVRDFRIGRRWIRRAAPAPWINREHAFAAETPGPGPVALSPGEHEGYLWTTPARARELLRWPGNERALNRLERRLSG